MSDAPPPGLAPGLEASLTHRVRPEDTIASYDPRLPAVFATPAMIGLMEVAAAKAVQPALAAGTLTVGTRIEVDHLKAARVGDEVLVHARLAAVDGRFLTFEVEARSGKRVLGRGRVFRAVVERQKFQDLADGA